MMNPFQHPIANTFKKIQNRITNFLDLEGSPHLCDHWQYHQGQGGGATCIYQDNSFLEKGAVNFSAIHGASFPGQGLPGADALVGKPYLATGLSLVLHPKNPWVPTIHMNIRYFETETLTWFGGGIDLTPYYLKVEDVQNFHRALYMHCNAYGQSYAQFKKQCDDYFYLPHRNETRGVGGLFFDRLAGTLQENQNFVVALGDQFNDLYAPFITYKNTSYTPAMRDFQLWRRGRYVEFNLLYDRGTHFGLQSGGRTESILASLPNEVHWRYNYHPVPGTPEDKLCSEYLKAQDWI